MTRTPTALTVQLQRIADETPTTEALGRDLTVELSRLGLATRLDEFDGPVEPHHRWRLTHLGRVVLDPDAEAARRSN